MERMRDAGRAGVAVGVADGLGVCVGVDVRVDVAVEVCVAALVRVTVRVGVADGVGLATKSAVLSGRPCRPCAVTYAYAMARPETTVTAATTRSCLLRSIHSRIYSISIW
jgi:hypothetical protein